MEERLAVGSVVKGEVRFSQAMTTRRGFGSIDVYPAPRDHEDVESLGFRVAHDLRLNNGKGDYFELVRDRAQRAGIKASRRSPFVADQREYVNLGLVLSDGVWGEELAPEAEAKRFLSDHVRIVSVTIPPAKAGSL